MSEPILKDVIRNEKITIRIMGGLHYIKGNNKPYFTITARTKDSGGCLHDEIMKYAPEFKKLIDIHLADIDGIPMHSVENGWYWMGKTKYQTANKENLANHFRISLNKAEDLIEKINSKDELVAWVESMKPVWKAEAIEVIEKYDLKIFGNEYKIN